METVLQDLCEGFKKSKHHTRVICSNDKNKNSFTQDRNLEIFKYNVIATIASQPITPSLVFNFYHHVKWADIIHIHSPNPLIELLALFIPKSKKVICTHHSDIFKQKILKLFYSPIWKLYKKRVNKFIVPTVNHIKYSNMIHDMSAKTQIIPFGIQDEKYNQTDNVDLKKLYGDYTLFVGRLVEYKGLRYLIKSMEQIEKNLVIVGRGPEKESLERLIQATNQSHKIFILSDVNSQKLLNTYYQQAYCFVLPSISKNENFGIVQLEAMKFSLPIITTNIKSGVPVVGVPGKTTILVEPTDESDLHRAITKLYASPQLAKKLGIEGHSLYLKKYTYKTMISSHLQTYLDLTDDT